MAPGCQPQLAMAHPSEVMLMRGASNERHSHSAIRALASARLMGPEWLHMARHSSIQGWCDRDSPQRGALIRRWSFQWPLGRHKEVKVTQQVYSHQTLRCHSHQERKLSSTIGQGWNARFIPRTVLESVQAVATSKTLKPWQILAMRLTYLKTLTTWQAQTILGGSLLPIKACCSISLCQRPQLDWQRVYN